MRYIFSSLLICLSFACVTLAPKSEREIITVLETKVSKDDAYDRALIWFAKNLNNSNWAVQVKDKPNGRIVSNIKLLCPNMSAFQSSIGNKNYIDFSVDLTLKDKKVRIIFENLVYSVWNYQSGETVHGPTSAEESKKIEANCLASIRSDLVDAINGLSSNTRSDDF
ncbi:DUF4468 domain-containing protein [Leptospira bouyouniensis]|uniref:DUF4468 domain-containing protein n=1 Tax=Leptospira bouyouniensis TaxID=2484911 RepID=A0ABY2KZ76_9LEPT|nr:DUF4468 domain-containing protein [Leptospira bouyouniensis]